MEVNENGSGEKSRKMENGRCLLIRRGDGRRPYEICLFAKKRGADGEEPEATKRRIVFAVPTVEHSRKPFDWADLAKKCFLKSTMVPCASSSSQESCERVVQLGNECLKFSDALYWK